MQTLIYAVQVIAVFQAVFFAVFLVLRSRPPGLANAMLAAFLIAIAIQVAAAVVSDQGAAPGIIDPRPAVAFAIGPLFYSYVRALSGAATRMTLRQGAHFLPFGLASVWLLWGVGPTPLFGIALYVSLFAYLAAAFREQRLFARRLSEEFADFERLAAPWLRQVIVFFAIVAAIDFVSNVYNPPSALWLNQLAYAAVMASIAAFIAFMVFKALEQPKLFAGREMTLPPEAAPKYHYSQLTEADVAEAVARLDRLMAHDKPHLREDVSLRHIADAVGVTPRELSQIINETYGRNFADFVNRARVADVIAAFSADPQGARSITEIMTAAGFPSKSTFNRAFKRVTEQTPSAYRQRLADGAAEN